MEADKPFAKRVVDQRPAPEALPEQHDLYFNMGNATVMPIDSLISTKTEAENQQGGDNGPKRMAAAAAGELGKRDPITVMPSETPGKFEVVDGNGTLTSVKKYGWQSMPVTVVPREQGLAMIEADHAKEAAKGMPIQPMQQADGMPSGPVKLDAATWASRGESARDRQWDLNHLKGKREKAGSAFIGDDEVASLTAASAGSGFSPADVIEEARKIKLNYPEEAGWQQPIAVGLEPTGNHLNDRVKFKVIPYGFHIPPSGKRADAAAWSNEIAGRMTNEIAALTERAKTDKTAASIIDHMTWYRTMARRLRQEFGGFGDVFADLLGATSPNTPVRTNWDFSVDVLRRFVRGEFDQKLAALERHLAAGGSVTQFKEGPDLITQITGKKYGMNSDKAMKALLGLWRSVKAGDAPKARNFALNLIGQSDKATIDVWAARMLQRLAGLGRIPPRAEGAVTGNHLVDPSVVGGQFGFGQAVFEKVAASLRAQGIDVTAPDLQAVAWFMEKELWTKNGWTRGLGSEGSFEQEADKMPTDRYQVGATIARYDSTPSDSDMQKAGGDMTASLAGDPGVYAYRAIPTSGMYAGSGERSFDIEVVAERGWNPDRMVADVARKAKAEGQLDAFVSRALDADERNQNWRPGIEVYFKTAEGAAKAEEVINRITKHGIDGFTLIKDPREARGATGADTGKYVGLRLQYVPEIFMRWADQSDPAQKRELDILLSGDHNAINALMAEKEDAMAKAVASLSGVAEVAYSAVVHYDTLVIGKENYDDYTGIAGAPDQAAGKSRSFSGQPAAEVLQGAARRLGIARDGEAAVPVRGAGQGLQKQALAQGGQPLKTLAVTDVIPEDVLSHVRNLLGERPAIQKTGLPEDVMVKATLMLKPLVEAANRNKPAYDKALAEIAREIGGVPLTVAVKGAERSAVKLVDENQFDTSKMMDLLRGTILVSTEAEARSAIAAISKRFKLARAPKDRFARPTREGYRDIMVNPVMPDGTVTEILIMTPEMFAAKDLGHEIYNHLRAEEAPNTWRVKAVLASKMIYALANERMSAANSSSLTGMPLWKAEAAGNLRGSGSNAMADRLSGDRATGLSSTSSKSQPFATNSSGVMGVSSNGNILAQGSTPMGEGAQRQAGASFVYGPLAINEAGAGLVTQYRPKLDERSMARRGLEPLERKQVTVIDEALGDIIAAGLPRSWAEKATFYGLKPIGLGLANYNPEDAAVGILTPELDQAAKGVSESKLFIRGWLAHELHHLVDNYRNSATEMFYLSAESPRMDMRVLPNGKFVGGGDLAMEALNVWNGITEASDEVVQYLGYPMLQAQAMASNLAGAEGAMAFAKVELFAQLGAMYTTNPKLMERELPQWFAFFEEWSNARGNGTVERSRVALRGLFQKSVPQRADQGRGRGAGLPAGAVGQDQQRPVLTARRPGMGANAPGAGNGGGSPVLPASPQAAQGQNALGAYKDIARANIPGNNHIPTHVNYSTFNSANELKKVYAGLSEKFEKEIQEQRRGTISHKESYRDARRLIEDEAGISARKVDSLLSRQPGTPAGAAEILARMAILESEVAKVEAMAKKIDQQGTLQTSGQEWLDFAAQLDRAAMAHQTFLGARAEIGRALNAIKGFSGMPYDGKQVQSVLDTYQAPKVWARLPPRSFKVASKGPPRAAATRSGAWPRQHPRQPSRTP